jgi:hypothetical protein
MNGGVNRKARRQSTVTPPVLQRLGTSRSCAIRLLGNTHNLRPLPLSLHELSHLRISTNIQQPANELARVGALFSPDEDATCRLVHRQTGYEVNRTGYRSDMATRGCGPAPLASVGQPAPQPLPTYASQLAATTYAPYAV